MTESKMLAAHCSWVSRWRLTATGAPAGGSLQLGFPLAAHCSWGSRWRFTAYDALLMMHTFLQVAEHRPQLHRVLALIQLAALLTLQLGKSR